MKMLGVLALVALVVLPQTRSPFRLYGAAAAPAGVIQFSDLSCAGVFLTPDVWSGTATTTYPMTFRYESGTRTYFEYDGLGHVWSYPEPTLSSCGTAIGSVNAVANGSRTDWGILGVNAGSNYAPILDSNVLMQGIYIDPSDTTKLYTNWYASYAATVQHNSLARLTLGAGTFTVDGCWGFDNPYNMTQVGSGILEIPSAFVSTYLAAGRRLAVGNGGYLGYAVANSYGPVLVAINPPTGNACASNTDTFIGSYTELERHASGGNTGPNCAPTGTPPNADDPGPWVGCTPTATPTTPYAARQAFTQYSKALYPQTWDPYAGHGWIGTAQRLAWYDDGVKAGVVNVYLELSGWVNQTVLASPTPTYSGGTGTFSITSTNSHDGNNINPGDNMWVQTCTPGSDGVDCTVNNGKWFTFARVDTVNTGTGAIAYTATAVDSGTGNHKPVVGGGAFLSWLYAQGAPCTSRFTSRVQTYNPSSYAAVIAGGNPYDVQYSSEGTGAGLFGTQMGDPSLGGGMATDCAGAPSHISVAAVMADPSVHQVMVSFGQGFVGGGHIRNLVVVLNVSQAPPVPQPTPFPWATLLIMSGVGLSVLWTRRMGVS